MKSNILCLFFIYNLKNLKENNVENYELCVFNTILKQNFPKHINILNINFMFQKN
jgi:hypothetical protein